MLCFRDLGASFSSFGCFVLRSSFSSASFSKLPLRGVDLIEWHAALFEWFELVAYATVSTLPSKRSEVILSNRT